VTTNFDEPAHTHPVSTSTTTSTSTTLTQTIIEGLTATGITVTINGVDRTTALGGGTGFTTDQLELDITAYLTIGIKNTIDLGTTQNGRIVGHLRLTGYLQSV
jgi:hypothetical protein